MLRGKVGSIAWAWVVLAAAPAGCSDTEQDDAGGMTSAGGKADDFDDDDALLAVTATQVEALDEDVSSIEPPVERFVAGDAFAPGVYLRPMSALGQYGPLGPFGPLGTLGPVGDATWNPSTFVDLAGPWSTFAGELSANEGPLSAEGPLGQGGPLDRDAWRETLAADPSIDAAFVQQLEPGGVFVALGPVGPLGALGPLGPLGPVGAHGYVADDDGQWIPGDDTDACVHSDERGVCRFADVPWTDGDDVRTYELYEHYDEAFAQAMTDNDTSFMVTGAAEVGASDRYAMTSAQTQVVTVVVLGQWTLYDPLTAMGLLGQAALQSYRLPSFVPNYVFPFNVYDHEASFDDFDVTLTIDDGTTVRQVSSDSAAMVDWISVVVPAGAELEATVSLHARWSAPWRVFGPEYRLYVVGSTSQLSGIDVRGDHLVAAAVVD